MVRPHAFLPLPLGEGRGEGCSPGRPVRVSQTRALTLTLSQRERGFTC